MRDQRPARPQLAAARAATVSGCSRPLRRVHAGRCRGRFGRRRRWRVRRRCPSSAAVIAVRSGASATNVSSSMRLSARSRTASRAVACCARACSAWRAGGAQRRPTRPRPPRVRRRGRDPGQRPAERGRPAGTPGTDHRAGGPRPAQPRRRAARRPATAPGRMRSSSIAAVIERSADVDQLGVGRREVDDRLLVTAVARSSDGRGPRATPAARPRRRRPSIASTADRSEASACSTTSSSWASRASAASRAAAASFDASSHLVARGPQRLDQTIDHPRARSVGSLLHQ